MGSSKQKRLPAVVGELLAQVETWRRTREKCGPMPEELWSEAVVLAKEHGTCRIARAVGIDYASLRGRLQRSGTAPTRQDESSGSFVELPTTVPAGRLACREPVRTVEGGAGSTAQLVEAGVEPTATYMTNHWDKLTLFLRVPGAPLDNNLVERSLKRAILHRRNSLFYKTENGARVGDLFMTLIHTAELEGINAFDYLVAAQRPSAQVEANPGQWMPWNYRETLANLATTVPP